MAAHEEERERIVLIQAHVRLQRRDERPLGPELARDGFLPPPPGHLAPHLIREPAQGDVVEPAAGIAGNALLRPLGRRRDQRLLHGVGARLGHTSGGALMTWRTSTGMTRGAPPGPGADEALTAIS